MKTPLPPILETKLADFRRRVWIIKLAEGVFAALFGLALSYLAVFAVDRFMETPRWLRAFLLMAGAAALTIGLPLKWFRWVWRQRRLEDAARLLRRTFPRLGDQLLGIVELARLDAAAQGRSERLVEAAMAQAAAAVKDHDFKHAVPDAHHRQWFLAAAGAAFLAALGFILVHEAAFNALERWIAPWREVERFTFAKIEPLPSHKVVPIGEAFELPVRLAPDSRWSPARLKARIAHQPWVFAQASAGAYTLAFPPQKQEAPLSIILGDVRERVLLQPRPRPELTELGVRVRLPAYLGYRSEPRIDARSGSVGILKGAEASVQARVSREVQTAELDGLPQAVTADAITARYERIDGDAKRTLTWRDRDGLTPREPLVLNFNATADEAPKVIARRETIEQVILDSEVVTFDLTATDDYGVKRLGLEWKGSALNAASLPPATGTKIAASGAAEMRELAARGTFCALREGVPPQTIEVRAWVEDYLPGREPSRSAAFVLHVLNKTEHALWLTEQFGKWLEAAKESYEREQQLHQTNKELRELTAADLDRPENRRRVSQQAAAESAQAARLEGLAQSGRNLVEQATKNDEFDAARLESWATMLKSLKDIAAARMPSVADLLKQTAAAAGSQAGAKAQPDPVAAASPPESSNPGTPDLGRPGAESAPRTERPDASKPSAGGGLSLPTVQLGPAPNPEGGAAGSPAQQKMNRAVEEQKELLAEFARIADELGELLASLEASSFVKRFKAASREQMAIAARISQKTLSSFGIDRADIPAAQPIARDTIAQSESVRVIQSDLDAYYQRKQDSQFKAVLDQMKKTEVVRALARGGEKLSANLSGQSLVGSEFWADTLDRWAEELVGASTCKSCTSGSEDSLPPEIVLKVMQSLRDEILLRDETRELANAKAALSSEKFTADARLLGQKQAGIGDHTQTAIDDILALPEAVGRFAKELRLLNAVVMVMQEAQSILVSPDTGPKAVAAETEAIELLLQTKRSGQGGGGGGSGPGGGGSAEAASSAALAELGPGSNAAGSIAPRPVGQATGHAGKEFPEEFKSGLDAYFNQLEK